MKTGEWFRAFFDRGYVRILRNQFEDEQTAAQVALVERALDLRPGASVLDVACGYGRDASELARRGYRVTGVDLSPAMIEEARSLWHLPGLRFRIGDMRRLRYRGAFDAAICMFTSFGYFSEHGNLAALRAMARSVRAGGRLLVDHRDVRFHRDHPTGKVSWKARKEAFVREQYRFHPKISVVESRWWIYRKGRAVERRVLRVMLYDLARWRRMLAACGARLVRAYSDYDGSPYGETEGARLILVAERVAVAGRARLSAAAG